MEVLQEEEKFSTTQSLQLRLDVDSTSVTFPSSPKAWIKNKRQTEETVGLDGFMEALRSERCCADGESNSRTAEKAEKPGKAGERRTEVGGRARQQPREGLHQYLQSNSTHGRINSQSLATVLLVRGCDVGSGAAEEGL